MKIVEIDLVQCENVTRPILIFEENYAKQNNIVKMCDNICHISTNIFKRYLIVAERIVVTGTGM